MQPERWFVEELRSTWPRLLVSWERYRERELIIPVVGDAYWRTVGADGVVEHVYLGRNNQPETTAHQPFDPSKEVLELEDDYGGKWFTNPSVFEEGMKPHRPHRRDISDGRFVVREVLGSAKKPKVLDLVDEEGRLHPLDREAIRWIAKRANGWDTAEAEIEANEAAAKAENEARVNDILHGPLEALVESTTGHQQVGWTPATEQHGSFTVTDMRRVR